MRKWKRISALALSVLMLCQTIVYIPAKAASSAEGGEEVETSLCEICGADPCTCEQAEASCPYCESTLAEDGTVIHSEICNAAYAYDGSADRGKYVQLIPEVAEYGVSVSEDPVNDEGIWFYYDEFGEGTVMKITDWYWDPDTTGLWYCVELYSGSFPESTEEYTWPETPWILHDYTDLTYEYDATLEFVTVEESCGCCESCAGDETCTCECEDCACAGSEPEPEVPTVSGSVTDSGGKMLTDGEGNPITITVTGEALPEGAEVVATVPTVNGELLEGVFDIKVLVDGAEWQPIDEGETVTVSIPVDMDKECVGVLHFIDHAAAIDGDEQLISTEGVDADELVPFQPAIDACGDGIHVAMETISDIRVADGIVSFETDSFSLYTPDYEIVTDGAYSITFTSSDVADVASERTYYAPIGQVINFKTEWNEGTRWTITNLSGGVGEEVEITSKWYNSYSSCQVIFDATGIEIGDVYQIDWVSAINNKNPRWTRVMIVGEFETIFNANGGQFSDSTAVLEQTVVSYQPVSMVEEPTRPGYMFTGWGTTQDSAGGGTVYTSADSFPATLPAGTTFYAQWEPMQYTVTYVVPDGVSNASLFTEQTKYHDVGLTLHTDAPDDMGDGVNFLYWIGSDGNEYYPGGSYTVNEDLILVSEWSPAVYSVVYDANGGTSAPAPQYAYAAQGYVATIATEFPQRTGYSFDGWNTAADGNGTAYTGGVEYTLTKSVILYAQWSAITYTIQFNGYGSTSGDMSDNAMGGLLYNTSYANLIANEYAKTDYTFQGWSLTQGGVVQYSNGQNVKVSDLVDAAVKEGQTGDTITLYAVWAQSTYKIIYQAADGDSGVSITNLSQTVIYELAEQTTINSSASRNRYTFAGWSDGTNVYQNGASVPVPSPEEDGATITLTATWKMNIVGYICTMVDGSPVMMGTVSAGGYTDPGNPVSYITIPAENGDEIPDMIFTPVEGYEITRIVIEGKEYADVSSMLNDDGTYTYDGFTATTPHYVAVITSQKEEVISVTVTWGSLLFDYTYGAWQPTSHTYEADSIEVSADQSNTVTVRSDGNVAVDVSITYAPLEGYTSITGYFTVNNDSTETQYNETFTLTQNGDKTLYLWLSGTMDRGKSDGTYQCGTCTVTIAKGGG